MCIVSTHGVILSSRSMLKFSELIYPFYFKIWPAILNLSFIRCRYTLEKVKFFFFCNLKMVDIIVGTLLVLWEKWSGCPGNRRKVCYGWSCRQGQPWHDQRVGSRRGRRRKAVGGTAGREGETGRGTNPAGTSHLSGEGVGMYSA